MRAEEIAKLIDRCQAEKQQCQPDKRLAFVRQRLRDAPQSSQPMELAERLIWIIHLYTEHAKTGQCPTRELRQTMTLGQDILNVLANLHNAEGVERLHSNFFIGLSKLARFEGDGWRSAWDYEEGQQGMRQSGREARANALLGDAHRLLKLGFGGAACDRLREASGLASADLRARCQITLARTLRITERENTAAIDKCLRACLDSAADPRPFAVEAEWERQCLAMQNSEGRDKPFAVVLAGQSHHHPDYVYEAILWAYALGDEVWIKRLPKVRYLKTKGEFSGKSLGLLVGQLAALEGLWDSEVPLHTRLQQLRNEAVNLGSLIHVEHDQLMALAFARWLIFHKKREQAELLLLRYQAQSWSLTSGRDDDHLGIACTFPKGGRKVA